MEPEQIICYKYYYVRIFDYGEQYGPFVDKEQAETVRSLIVSYVPHHYNGRNYISEYSADEAGADIQVLISEEKLSSTVETVETFLAKTDKIKDATMNAYNIAIQWVETGKLKIYANSLEDAEIIANQMIKESESKVVDIAFNRECNKGTVKLV